MNLVALTIETIRLGQPLAFALRGLWYIPVFSFAELVLVAIALLYYLRHARDYEHLALRDGVLLIEQVSAGRHQRSSFRPWCTRIAVPEGPRQLIRISCGSMHVEVGAFATPERRVIFDINDFRLDASIATQLKKVKQQFIDRNRRIV